MLDGTSTDLMHWWLQVCVFYGGTSSATFIARGLPVISKGPTSGFGSVCSEQQTGNEMPSNARIEFRLLSLCHPCFVLLFCTMMMVVVAWHPRPIVRPPARAASQNDMMNIFCLLRLTLYRWTGFYSAVIFKKWYECLIGWMYKTVAAALLPLHQSRYAPHLNWFNFRSFWTYCGWHWRPLEAKLKPVSSYLFKWKEWNTLLKYMKASLTLQKFISNKSKVGPFSFSVPLTSPIRISEGTSSMYHIWKSLLRIYSEHLNFQYFTKGSIRVCPICVTCCT